MTIKNILSGLVVLASLAGCTAVAQVDTGVVTGTVKDSSGAAIPRASVLLLNMETGVKTDTRSDAAGEYQFSVVPVGNYKVSVQNQGFQPSASTVFRVDVGSRQRVDAVLQVEGTTQGVTVNANESVAVVESDTSDRGEVVEEHEVVNLPLNGRNYSELALLAPGVNRSQLGNPDSDTSREGSFNVNGLRSTNNDFLLDGLDNNSYSPDNNGYSNQAIQISPDGLSEFKIETDNFAAEYGRSGGGIINAATKSGTNTLHGSVWEYLRNTYFDAKGEFTVAPSATVPNPTPTLIQNQFGGAIGGKIIPQKLFFFADYEGLRRAFHKLQTSTLPTANQRAGTFTTTDSSTGTAIPVRNPYTGTIYAGQLPASAFTANPLAPLVLSALPLPNLPGLSSNFSVFPGGEVDVDKGDGRLDYFLNQRLNFFFRYSQLKNATFDPPPIPGPAGGYSKGNINIGVTQYAFGANVTTTSRSTLDARFAYTPSQSKTLPPGYGETSLLAKAGIPGIPTNPAFAGSLNSQQLSQYSKFGRDPSVPTVVNPSTWNALANYSLLFGKHSVKAGFSYIAVNTTIQNFHPQYGTDTYKGQFSAPTGVKAPAASATAYKEAWAMTDFLYGARDTYELSNDPAVDYRQRIYGIYVQDDWRATNALVVNAGVRYEVGTPLWVANNNLANYNPMTNSLVSASPGSIYNRTLQNLNLANLGPRLGLAFTPVPNTAIRAGYGISYVQFNRTGSVGSLANNAPFVIDSLVTQIGPTSSGGSALCATAATTCFNPTQLGYPTNFTSPAAYDPLVAQAYYRPSGTPTGYVQAYQLSVQHQFPAAFILDVAYVGNRGVHEALASDYNQAVPNNASGSQSLQSRRPDPTFSGIQILFDGGGSNYNALQTKVEHRSHNGLYILDSFTWARAFDESGGPTENIGNGDTNYVNLRNVPSFYARSDFDIPLNNTFSVVWDLPYGPGHRFGSGAGVLGKELLAGWELTTITISSSGTPVDIIYTPSSSQTVSTLLTYLPNITGRPSLANRTRTSNALQLLDPGAVAIPAINMPFGNAQRNAARGLSYNSSNIGLHKKFFLSSDGKRNFELRVESFNAFNHGNYGLPDSNVSDAAYGQVTTALPAREMQFAGRLSF